MQHYKEIIFLRNELNAPRHSMTFWALLIYGISRVHDRFSHSDLLVGVLLSQVRQVTWMMSIWLRQRQTFGQALSLLDLLAAQTNNKTASFWEVQYSDSRQDIWCLWRQKECQGGTHVRGAERCNTGNKCWQFNVSLPILKEVKTFEIWKNLRLIFACEMRVS